jgi:hypothetical protein
MQKAQGILPCALLFCFIASLFLFLLTAKNLAFFAVKKST